MKQLFAVIFLSIFVTSCRNPKATNLIDDLNSNKEVSLKNWNYIILQGDTVNRKLSISNDYLKSTALLSEVDFSKTLSFNELLLANSLPPKVHSVSGYKSTRESILDFDEMGKAGLTGAVIYMYCNINSSKDQTVFFMSRSTDGLKLWVNGKEMLQTVESRGFEQYFSDFVKIQLNKGSNKILLKKIVKNTDLLFEVKLASYNNALPEYKKSQNGLVLRNAIVNDTIKLKEKHAKCFELPICYTFKDIQGKAVYTTTKYPNLSDTTIIAPSLKSGYAYMCSFKLGDQVISQPFFKGDPDDYIKKINAGRHLFKNATQKNIEPYLYRLDKLLKHESRKSDWWWSFKVANVIYEIENCINNSKDKSQSDFTFGIQYKAFTSILDSSTQHYLLVTPDSLSKDEKIPLVLILRPFIENQQHFLTSPQMSRYWGLLWAKNLSNKYRYVIVMPSARLYQYEPMTPMAEFDVFQALKDVDKYYSIDHERIYLHGNCSAGYRSLVLAGHHPSVFAALGLYAPVTDLKSERPWILENSPKRLMTNFSQIPIILHYDPLDKHNPYSEFKDFISDCPKNSIKLTVSTQKYSGVHYNVQLVGEEALTFFKDKKINYNSDKYRANKKVLAQTVTHPVILDFFARPFIFVVNYQDYKKGGKTAAVTDSVIKEYKELLFAHCPIKYDSQITANDLETKNIFFIGHQFNNHLINEKLWNIPLLITANRVELNKKVFNGKNITFESIFKSPFNAGKQIIVYSTNADSEFKHEILAPWRSGFENQVILYH